MARRTDAAGDKAPASKSESPEADKGNAEVAKRMDAELEQGYVGTTFDTNPNSAYSLASGPDGPPLIPDNNSRVEQHSVPAQKES
jgi:hypothetical protein